MTRTSPSIAAGSERPRPPPPPRELLAGWLRRAERHPEAHRYLLRGSVLLAAWCPPRARPAGDVDYLGLGGFDASAVEALARELAAAPDPGGDPPTTLTLERTELTWVGTEFPGLRAHLTGRLGAGAPGAFQVDFGFGDPLSLPPRPATIAGVGQVLACAPETMFAWKLHGLVEHGTGKWRAKDLYDLELLWMHVPLGRAALRPAVELAFASRSLPLDALADFRSRDSWGQSRGGVRKWRALAQRVPAGVTLAELAAVRARVRVALDEILGPLG